MHSRAFRRPRDADPKLWWDPQGPWGVLHAMMPVRMDWIAQCLSALDPAGADRGQRLSGWHVADWGCGGGLVCEPLARLGARVLGIDQDPDALVAAVHHWQDSCWNRPQEVSVRTPSESQEKRCMPVSHVRHAGVAGSRENGTEVRLTRFIDVMDLAPTQGEGPVPNESLRQNQCHDSTAKNDADMPQRIQDPLYVCSDVQGCSPPAWWWASRRRAIVMMDMIEHVPSPFAVFQHASQWMQPGDVLIGATLNRTMLSGGLGIMLAERVLRWVPRGTHDWHRFLMPDEVGTLLTRAGLVPTACQGFRMAVDCLDDVLGCVQGQPHWTLCDTQSTHFFFGAYKTDSDAVQTGYESL